MYKIERWTERGITSQEASTKKEANRLASLARAEMASTKQWGQTVVIFPNGSLRICRAIQKSSS